MISRLVSLEHPHEIKPGMVFALETFWPTKDGTSAARIEEEIVVTATGHEVITRFPAEELLVAGAPFVTVGGTAADSCARPRRRRIRKSRRWLPRRRRRKRRSEKEKVGAASLMAISVVMPALEMAQETGKLVSWKKKAGDQVKKGEMLLEVETDKAVVEIEAAGDGVLGGVTAKEGDVVPVGQTIAWLLKPGEQPPSNVAAVADRPQDGLGARGGSGRRCARRARAGVGRRRADLTEGPSSRARARRGHRHAPRLRPGRRNPRRRHHEGCVAVRAGCSRLRRSRAACRRPTDAAACDGSVWSARSRQLDRPHHGRADDAELDERAALLRHARSRCQRAQCHTRAADPGHREVARREGHAHRPARRRGGACTATASAHERQLGQRQDHAERATSTSRWRWRWRTRSSRP